MFNPNRPSSANGGGESADQNSDANGWDSLIDYRNSGGQYETEDVEIPLEELAEKTSKLETSENPMGPNRKDVKVIATDAEGDNARTSNLMVGYNKRGVQIGDRYFSAEELHQGILEYLEENTDDKVLGFVRKDDEEMRFMSPMQVADQIMADLMGVGPEAHLSPNDKITNQDARSVEFSGPNGEVQRGVFMLGNAGIDIPNGVYLEDDTVKGTINEYAKVSRTDEVVPPIDGPGIKREPGDEREPGQGPKDGHEAGAKPEAESNGKTLEQAREDLAELYAKNRRLFVGRSNREKFEAAKHEYEQLLAEHLSEMSHGNYGKSFDSMSGELADMANELSAQNISELTEFVGGDLDNPNKTPEEIEAKREELRQAAEAKMRDAYPSMIESLEAGVNGRMLAEYAKERSKLEAATIEALDNGSLCRKAVSKIINNKWLKRGLAVASAAGLAITAIGIGQGVADGTLAVSLGYTAGGIAAGAARGGLAGFLMSRQSSESSVIDGYGGDDVAESVKERVESGEYITAQDLAAESMFDYSRANRIDASGNKIRTSVATGIGAMIGGVASGVHVDDVKQRTFPERVQTGTQSRPVEIGRTPEELHPHLDRIDIHPGSGMSETFADLGGDPNNYQMAVEIAHQFDSQFGMVPGSNGVVAGVNGQVGNFAHTYPGAIDTWPAQAREYITAVAEEWAKHGLIDAAKTGGEPIMGTVDTPIFSTIEKTVVHYLPNLFYTALAQAEATLMSASIGTAMQ